MNPDHILLSCTCDFYSPTPYFHAELMPVETPDYIKGARLSDNDLFFLRWVFENHFHFLTTYIEQNLPQYRIHLARPEPGIDWESYRNKKRGFLVWLVKSKEYQDPLSNLKASLKFYKAQEERKKKELEVSAASTTEDLSKDVAASEIESGEAPQLAVAGDGDHPSEESNTSDNLVEPGFKEEDSEVDVPKMVAEQLELVRTNIKKYYEEMEEIEGLVNEIWTMNGSTNASFHSLRASRRLAASTITISASTSTVDTDVSSSNDSSDSIHEGSVKSAPESASLEPEEAHPPENQGNEWCVVGDDQGWSYGIGRSANGKPLANPSGLLSKVRAHATKIGGL